MHQHFTLTQYSIIFLLFFSAIALHALVKLIPILNRLREGLRLRLYGLAALCTRPLKGSQ